MRCNSGESLACLCKNGTCVTRFQMAWHSTRVRASGGPHCLELWLRQSRLRPEQTISKPLCIKSKDCNGWPHGAVDLSVQHVVPQQRSQHTKPQGFGEHLRHRAPTPVTSHEEPRELPTLLRSQLHMHTPSCCDTPSLSVDHF